jgi:hypothetical protein
MTEPLIPFALYNECIELGKVVLADGSQAVTSHSNALMTVGASSDAPPNALSPRANAPSARSTFGPTSSSDGSDGIKAPIPSRLPPSAHATTGSAMSPGLPRALSPPNVPAPTMTREALTERMQKMANEVPALHRRIMQHIVSLIRAIAAEKDINKMSVPNLAIVFAPSFLRHVSDDPMVLTCFFRAPVLALLPLLTGLLCRLCSAMQSSLLSLLYICVSWRIFRSAV